MADPIRCSRCQQTLEPDAFAPSHRTPGGWCRVCRKTYMATYHKDRKPQPKCRDCGAAYTPWQAWAKPGAAHRRCHACYLAYTRKRQTPRPKAPRPRKPGALDQGILKRLRADVLATETHCGFCRQPVDKTLPGNHRMGPAMDHIIPLALGGAPYDRGNVRLAHHSCNSAAVVNVHTERLRLTRAALWLGAFL